MIEPIRILIADDNHKICDTLEEILLIELTKFDIDVKNDVVISKVFTEHAFEHGSGVIKQGFKPNICIFDLIFNGYSGIDLYNFLSSYLGKNVDLCIYMGVEKRLEKRKEAESMASMTNGYIKIVSKPNVSEIVEWFNELLINKFNLIKLVDEKDPFDLL
jgi:flavodoxin